MPYHVYGGMQDNGSWVGPGYVWKTGGIINELWQEVEKSIDTAMVMINSNVAHEAGYHLTQALTQVTTIGQIRNIRVRELEGFPYNYPVLDTDTLVLWEKRRKVVVYRGYHDPFYYRYPWGYPYWGYRHTFPYRGPTYAEERSLLPDPAVIESGNQVVKPGDKD